MLDLKKLLLDKIKNAQLASFYILRQNRYTDNANTQLLTWMQELLSTALNLALPQVLEHPDVLVLRPQQNKKIKQDYQVEDFVPFFQFLDMAPFQFKQRFIIITNAERIGTNLSNKLLKSLEEANINTTIFMLQEENHQFLPTIQGRAVFLTLSLGPTQQSNQELPADFLEELNLFLKEHQGGQELLERFKDSPELEKQLTEYVISQHLQNKVHYSQLETLINALKWQQKSKIFHNRPQGRISELLEMLSAQRSNRV